MYLKFKLYTSQETVQAITSSKLYKRVDLLKVAMTDIDGILIEKRAQTAAESKPWGSSIFLPIYYFRNDILSVVSHEFLSRSI